MARREKEIRIMVSETELKNIETNAQKLKIQIAPYLRMIGQNPTIIQYDYSIIENHTKEIGEVRADINRLIFTIQATNNYLPREIKSIVEMINGIFESENKLLRTLREERTRQYEKDRGNTKRESQKQQR